MKESKKSQLSIDFSQLDGFFSNDPVTVSLGGQKIDLPGKLQFEESFSGSYYIKHADGQFKYFGVIISRGAFLYPDGTLKGSLGEDIQLNATDHPKLSTVTAKKGKEVEITSDGIIRCEVYDLSEGMQPGPKYELRRDLKEQPNNP